MKISRQIVEDSIVLTDGGMVVLTLQEAETDGKIVITLSGNVRSDTVHDFLDELIALATVGADLVVDFEKVSYLCAAGQQALLTVQQKMDTFGKGTLTLRNLPEAIYEDFLSTGSAELLMIE